MAPPVGEFERKTTLIEISGGGFTGAGEDITPLADNEGPVPDR